MMDSHIKTHSLERSLLPLVTEISTLVSSPGERGGAGCDKTARALQRVGQAVNVAVDRFVTVGETIADDNPEIKVDMYEACKEARAAGLAIEKLCETAEANFVVDTGVGGGGGGGGGGGRPEYRASMIRAARCLLSSVTRVLLLADTVVVKQLLLAKDKVTHSLSRLESVTNFTEFVKAFSHFGAEMVELAHLTGDRAADLKDERRRAQMAAARQVLDRSTMMLLTASKVCLRHPECLTSRENRDTVFCQMRRAMDLIHYVVKDGVLDSVNAHGEARINGQSPAESPGSLRTRQVSLTSHSQEDWDNNHTMYGAIRHLEDSVEMTRMTLCGPAVRDRLCQAVDTICERMQDFTDSAYTSHEHRENILLLLDRIRLQVNQLLRVGMNLEQKEPPSPGDELETAINAVLTATREMKHQLQTTALVQAEELVRGACEESELISALKNAGLATDQERLDEYADRFLEHIEHIQEVCKLLRHIATTDSLQVAAKYGEINLRIYGPQVVTAAQTLCLYPTSKIAKENVEVFADMWLNLVGDVKSLTKDISDQISAENKPPEKQVYVSLPRPGKHGTTSKPPKPTKLDQEEQAKLAKSGLDMKLISSEVDQETEKWEERITQDEDNDIVKRAKNMSSMAFSMYQFTRGEGALKTTQDLFTQGEYFAEEANRLYKVVRQFSYQVPAGPHKKELMEHLDQIPTYVQQLQFTVKNPTVGKAATFTKVDNVIQETKNLMNVISKVVTTCFVCATKYELRLPERLELPTLDDVRASGQGNTIGQVPSTPQSVFPPTATITTTTTTTTFSSLKQHPTPTSPLQPLHPQPPFPHPLAMSSNTSTTAMPTPLQVPLLQSLQSPLLPPLTQLPFSNTSSPSQSQSFHHPLLSRLASQLQSPISPSQSPYSLVSPYSSLPKSLYPNTPNSLKYYTLPSSPTNSTSSLQYLNLHHSALQPSLPSASYAEQSDPVLQYWAHQTQSFPLTQLKATTGYLGQQNTPFNRQSDRLPSLLNYPPLNLSNVQNHNIM
ncbi:alpha-catulin-like isoform X3 [Portunus trituberculatus]|uniref:alpha-catulin-like isoform X3 n=1 Tax=Portunus trituberculatus TaxID=210409 RepID=UPI001E1D1B44|nr:alpha-catulin-like isoform X3 [Portunus trituberculatus]